MISNLWNFTPRSFPVSVWLVLCAAPAFSCTAQSNEYLIKIEPPDIAASQTNGVIHISIGNAVFSSFKLPEKRLYFRESVFWSTTETSRVAMMLNGNVAGTYGHSWRVEFRDSNVVVASHVHTYTSRAIGKDRPPERVFNRYEVAATGSYVVESDGFHVTLDSPLPTLEIYQSSIEELLTDWPNARVVSNGLVSKPPVRKRSPPLDEVTVDIN